MHILIIKKNTYDKSNFQKYILDQVSRYIGSSTSKGLNGLGQTISDLKISESISGNEFLSTMSSYFGGAVSFTRLPEKL